MWTADLTLLPFLSKDVTDQSLLKNFLFDQEMPKTSGWKGLMVLCPERKYMDKHTLVTYEGIHLCHGLFSIEWNTI